MTNIIINFVPQNKPPSKGLVKCPVQYPIRYAYYILLNNVYSILFNSIYQADILSIVEK